MLAVRPANPGKIYATEIKGFIVAGRVDRSDENVFGKSHDLYEKNRQVEWKFGLSHDVGESR